MSIENQELTVVEKVRKDAESVVERAHALSVIETDEQFRSAVEFRKLINGFKRQATLECKEIRESTTRSWKAAIALLDNAVEPFDTAMAIIDAPIVAFNAKRETERRLEEEKRMAAARKQAEEDQIAQAEAAQASGDTERAEAIISQPVQAPVILVPKPAPVPGVSFRENWKVDDLVNVRLLAQAIANGKASVECLIPNYPALNKMAKALKGSLNIPGVTPICEKTVASRS